MVCLFYLLKEPAFSFVDFYYGLFCLFFIISALIFMISFLLLTLGFFISSCSSCFRCRVRLFDYSLVSWGFPGSSAVKTSACNEGDPGLIPGLRRSPGEGNGNPLQYSCLGNPMDRGAWWVTVSPWGCRVGYD